MGDRRFSRITWARHCAMWIIRARWHYSYPHIGGLFHRDHTTVLSAVQRVNQAAAQDLVLAEWLAGEVLAP